MEDMRKTLMSELIFWSKGEIVEVLYECMYLHLGLM